MGNWTGKSPADPPPPPHENSESSSTEMKHRPCNIVNNRRHCAAGCQSRWSEIVPRPQTDPFHSLVCGISPAWRESSSTCTSWWKASHLRCRERNRRSPRHLPVRTHSLSSPSAVLQLACNQVFGYSQLLVGFISKVDGNFRIDVLPVPNEVGFPLSEWLIFHPFAVHFLTDFINCSLK